MDQIRVKYTRQNNEEKLLGFEEYIFGVVSSEIGNSSLEACKAQAVAARTTAYPYMKNNKVIPDAGVQAFREERINADKYPLAYQAVEETKGELLFYNGSPLSPCSFSASNGGRTTSSEDRWGGHRDYLIEQDDPYDYAVTSGKKTGHGVGMSQLGAKEMARRGFSYLEILSFYYPGTTLNGVEKDMSIGIVKASY